VNVHLVTRGEDKGDRIMKGSRSRRWIRALALAATVFALCAAAAQAQDVPGLPNAGDPTETTGDGNSASQSVGVVQVGPATVDPADATAGTPAGDAVAGAGATVGTQGGNHASQSGGVVQAGGSNSATRSAGAAQVSRSHGSTSTAVKTVGGTTGDASIGGNGSNSSRGSVGSAQIGSGNSTSGSTGAVAVQPTSATVTATVDGGPGASQTVSASGGQVLGDTLGVDLSSLATVPASATIFMLDLVASLRLAGITPPGVADSFALQ